MPGNVETELKFKMLRPDVGTDVRQALLEANIVKTLAPEWADTAMEAWYYDTDERSLQRAGIAYRVRREGGEWVATVKTGGSSDGGLHQRQEWNLPSPGKEPLPQLFADLPIGQSLLAAIGDCPLKPLFATVFERRSAVVVFEDASIELAVDLGEIVAGDRSEAICELELELKEGSPAAMLHLGALLAREIPLLPEPKSKYYRALLLAGIAQPQPQPTVALTEQTPLAEGLNCLITAAIGKAFAAYEAFMANPDNPRTVYKLRVKLRRLRSLLQLAKPCVAEQEYLAWRERLLKLSSTFARLRDIDVVAAEWEKLCSSPYVSFDSKPWLGEIIQKRRAGLLEQTLRQLQQTQFCAELLEFWAWAESRPWQSGDCPDLFGSYSRWRISGWLAALLDAGKAADWQNEQELHELRLRLKKIRYTLAASPFGGGRTEKLLLQAKGLQALLGAITDRVAVGRTLASLARGATRAVYRDIGLLGGWQAKSEEVIRCQLREQWKGFRQAARRWLEA